jgi:HEAT repeat protein
MCRRVFCVSRVLPTTTAAAIMSLVFGLSFLATPRSRMAQTSSVTSRASNSAAGNLVVLGTDVRDKMIRFGDELVVLLTLQNQGTKPIRIPPNALVLNNEKWIQGSGWGSGLGESPLVRTGVDAQEEFTLQPGESAALTASSIELGSHSMGSMKAEFVIETEDEDLRRELGKSERFTVSYYVAPSALMTSAWAAKTADEQKQLQPQIRELLLLASRPEESPGFYVSESLRHLGCHTLSLLESAMRDSDPIVRAQAVRALLEVGAGAEELNSFLSQLSTENEGRTWAASVERCQENRDLEERESVRLALIGLGDKDARVRIAAISVLTIRAAIEANLRRWLATNPRGRESMDAQTKQMYDSIGLVDPALPLIKKLAADADPGVRAEAQKFLSNFASQQEVARDVVASLGDSDASVRTQALLALMNSHDAPPMSTIEKAFASTKGEVALGLIELIYEREDSEMATRLTPGFQERSAAERLMILTAIAGHTDDAALKLVGVGLKDAGTIVQRAALMRLLAFPTQKAMPLIKTNLASFSPDVRQMAIAVQKELESRAMFPSLARGDSSLRESTFPSNEGTGPMVSPDGQWVAYVETGWGRPGGSGGMGRSNLLSITHVVHSDGTSDRVVSDMFLVGWTSDGGRVASARDGFAAIVNMNGSPVVEFGHRLDKADTGAGIGNEVWPTGEMRHQFGIRMPHSKTFHNDRSREAMFTFDYGEDAAFSPDGKWFGPRRVDNQWQFVDPDGNKREMKAPDRETLWGSQAVWSPDGTRVVVVPVQPSGSFGRDKVIEPAKAFVIDVSEPTIAAAIDVDQVWSMGGWNYRKGRWNPWSKDGRRLAFIRNGQAWISDPDGGNTKQVTFDASKKVFPTFSPDGTKIAYITWQFDNREHYTRLGPTDIWVVDIKTGLAARVTRADSGHIEGLDWLDNGTIIFDRLGPDDRHSMLRTVSLR